MKRLLVTLAALAALLLAVLTSAVEASAQKPTPFNLEGAGGFRQYDHILERQNAYYCNNPECTTASIDPSNGYIANPTLCVWDINDHFEYTASTGYLNPGQSSSRDDCMMAGVEPVPVCNRIGNGTDDGCGSPYGNDHWYGAAVYTKTPALTEQVCFQPEGRCFTDDTAVYNEGYRLYEYGICVQSIYDAHDPALGIIPGSVFPDPLTGGIPYGSFPYALQETVTLTVTNLGVRQNKTVVSSFGISSDIFFPYGCPQGFGGANRSDVPKATDPPFRWVVQ